MLQDLVEWDTQVSEKYSIEKNIIAHIKEEFLKKYNPTWHYLVRYKFVVVRCIKPKISSISTRGMWSFFGKNLVNSMDYVQTPMIHPKTSSEV